MCFILVKLIRDLYTYQVLVFKEPFKAVTSTFVSKFCLPQTDERRHLFTVLLVRQ